MKIFLFGTASKSSIAPRDMVPGADPRVCRNVSKSRRPGGLSFLLFALAALFGQAASSGQTNLTLAQRLDENHLKAVHEARLEFARQRHQGTSHGLYEDFRMVVSAQPAGSILSKQKQSELAEAARKTGVRAMLLAGHRGPSQDWRGLHDGVLFVPCLETNGVLNFPDSGAGFRLLSRVTEQGELAIEEIAGMEICERPTAARLARELREMSKNFRSYPDEFLGASTDYPSSLLAKWDEQTRKRRFVGIGAIVDPRSPGSDMAALESHELHFRNLSTHVLAQELGESSLREALTNGHMYVAHDWLCDPTGFMFGAGNNLGIFTMGDSVPMMGGRTRLMAATPLEAKLRLIHNGTMIQETLGTNLTFEAKEAGPYRLEAWLSVDGEDRPWVYSNPVYLKSAGLGDAPMPSMAVPPEIEVRKGITYTEGSEEDASKHKLDVYIPKGKNNSPVFFFIHGGAWKSGDRSLYPPLGSRYSRAGFITVVPSYRLAPKHPHPAQIEDVAAAFAWTARHVAELGGDTNRIYVGGHSAGGHLAALLALDEHYLAAHQVSSKMIHGVLALSGVYTMRAAEGLESVFGTDPRERKAASPLSHVKAGAPPFLVSYCEWDYLTLPAQAKLFYRALKEAKVNAELAYIPGENHLSEMIHVTREADPLVAAALKFMK